jgi:hypothetical protein
MTRATTEYIFTDQFLNEIFDDATITNYSRQFLFSDLVGVLTGVVFGTYPSVHRSYLNSPETQARGSIKCFYEKLQRVEPVAMRALVRATAERVTELRVKGGYPPAAAEPIPGYRLLSIDGNHLEATEKRLEDQVGAALPGQVLAVLEHSSGLVLEVLPWEDAHANEKEVLTTYGLNLRRGDVAVLDRQFCAMSVMDRVNAKKARFIIRHNASVGLHVVGERRACGKTETGRLYESKVRYAQTKRHLRCIEVELYTPTRNGETVIRLLSDLPKKHASARQVAAGYLQRRRIETAFWDLTVALTCEVETLAYPRAALFAFCVAVAVYNGLQAVRGAVASVHGADELEKLSSHTMAEEVSRMWDGLDLALGEEDWAQLRKLSPAEFAGWLCEAAQGMDLDYYHKATRGPKKPKLKATGSTPINSHSSTYRFLQHRKLIMNKSSP